MQEEKKSGFIAENTDNTDAKKGMKPLYKFAIYCALYLLFLLWVGSWWGLIVVPFIYDALAALPHDVPSVCR